MPTPEENLNNAISRLGVATTQSTASEGVKKAVRDLTAHWSKFWRSGERALTPGPMLASKLERYVKWYARAWVLLPSAARAQAPAPQAIDVTWQSLATATVSQQVDSMRAVAADASHGAAELGQWVDAKAQKLASEIVKPVAGYTMALAVVAVLGLYFYSRK